MRFTHTSHQSEARYVKVEGACWEFHACLLQAETVWLGYMVGIAWSHPAAMYLRSPCAGCAPEGCAARGRPRQPRVHIRRVCAARPRVAPSKGDRARHVCTCLHIYPLGYSLICPNLSFRQMAHHLTLRSVKTKKKPKTICFCVFLDLANQQNPKNHVFLCVFALAITKALEIQCFGHLRFSLAG